MADLISRAGQLVSVDGVLTTNPNCCCDECCNCVDLAGYTGGLKCMISGAMTGCTNLVGGVVDDCMEWANPGNVTPDEEDPCADFMITLDVRLVCRVGQTPRLIVGHSDDMTCNLNPRDTELEPDTLVCTPDNFFFEKEVDIVGVGCDCLPMKLKFTITKGSC